MNISKLTGSDVDVFGLVIDFSGVSGQREEEVWQSVHVFQRLTLDLILLHLKTKMY